MITYALDEGGGCEGWGTVSIDESSKGYGFGGHMPKPE